jgi:hypothetical protein
MRRLVPRIDPTAHAALALLADEQTSAKDYGNAFYRLGTLLVQRVPQTSLGKSILVVCTSEDADYFARGILESIVGRTASQSRVALACFWQTRLKAMDAGLGRDSIEIAPIVKRYEERSDEKDTLIVVKSIISSSCVVKHALLDIMGRKQPKKILIVAPVILRGAEARLREEFPADISRRFEFFYFAEDDQKDDSGNVRPGIGGSIYERLGLTERGAGSIPRLVLERRARYRTWPKMPESRS